MAKKVVVAGHICLDVTPVFPKSTAGSFQELLTPGKLIEMNAADVHTGGCVANTGLGMKKLGANVELVGKVGLDAFGGMIGDILRSYGAKNGLIVDKSVTTSYSVVLAPKGLDRVFLHHPGANATFKSSDLPDEKFRDTVLLHFGYPPLMNGMYENDGAELVSLMKRAKSLGCATSLAMAAVDPSSAAGSVDWQKLLSKVLPFVDFFMPSVEEICFMLDRARYESWQNAMDGDITNNLNIETDAAPFAERLLQMGAKVVLIKCGAPGVFWRTADEFALNTISERLCLDVPLWANKGGFEESFEPERVLSGTGAGDTTIAAFLTAVLDGCSPEECLRLATATGACCVEEYDALSGLRPFEVLREKIANGWKKQHLLKG